MQSDQPKVEHKSTVGPECGSEGVIKDFRKRFKFKRKLASLSLRDVEKLTGVSFATLGRFEKGRAEPSPQVFKQIREWILDDKTSPKIDRKTCVKTLSQRIERIEKHLGLTDDF